MPMKCSFKSNEEPEGLIRLKYRNIVRVYIQDIGVDDTESFSLVTKDTSTKTFLN